MLKTLTKLADAMRQGRADLDELRDRIADLQDERKRIAGLPADRAEAEKRLDEVIASQKANPLFAGSNRFLALPERHDRWTIDFLNSVNRVLREEHPFTVWAHVAPDTLRAAILADYPEGETITASGRTARLAKLDREIEDAEVAEESLIREMESATGARIPRRMNAREAVLLARDEEIGNG